MCPARMKQHSKLARGVIFAALVAISGGLLGNLCFSMFVPGQTHPGVLAFIITALLGLAVFAVSAWQLKRVAEEALSSRARVASDPADPRLGARPVLIMGLSPLTDAQQAAVGADIQRITQGAFGVEQIALSVAEFAALQSAAKTDGKAVPTATPWQQNIRAMWFHANPRAHARRRLRKVLVLPSQESREQFKLFKEYGEALFKDAVVIDFVRPTADTDGFFCIREAGDGECRDYESYDYVRDGLERAVLQARADGAFDDADICIDATPGQKPFSIAAAIMTLNSEIIFSYVTTGQAGSSRGGEVKLYDAHIDVTGFSS
jgi:hypothetical protein